jgi:hypothetical protein
LDCFELLALAEEPGIHSAEGFRPLASFGLIAGVNPLFEIPPASVVLDELCDPARI